MKRLAGVGAVLAITVGLSVWVGGQQADAGGFRLDVASAHAGEVGLLAPTEHSSRLILGARVRCTATVSSNVQAGDAVAVRLVLHNISKRAVTFRRGVFSASVVLRAPDGTVYDPNALYAALPGIPPPIPYKLRRGADVLLRRIAIPVRWRGPLELTPECLGKELPALEVRVAAPGPPADQSAAIAEVVAASGHLLDHCLPQTPGFPVDGQIDAPVRNVPPLPAECSISLSSEGSYLTAQVLVLSPSGLSGVQIFQPYETLWPNGQFVGLTSPPPYEAIAWEFVVTRERATPVAAASLTATNASSQVVPFFDWNGSGWRQSGSYACGVGGFSAGGRGPEIAFISTCAS
jgi:hypothetical protein